LFRVIDMFRLSIVLPGRNPQFSGL
jgi:hypothetical protein